MNTNNITTDDVREISHPQVAKRANITVISVSLILILTGILAFVLWSGTAGSLIIVAGALAYIIKPKIEVYEPTGSHVVRRSFYIATEKSEAARSVLEGTLNDSIETLQFLQQGGTRLDLLISKDKGFAAWQLFHFVPHKYVPASNVFTLTGPPAVNFARYIERSEKG